MFAATLTAVAACGSSGAMQTGGTTSSSASAGGGNVGGEGPGTGGGAIADAGADADNGHVSTTYPAAHPSPPQVEDLGGNVLTSPKVVPVFFGGDDAPTIAKVTDFLSKVGTTAYWTATTTEYGVGPLTSTAPVQLTETAAATLDDAAIQAWLSAKLNGDDPAFPVADDNTVYSIHYPASTVITQAGGLSGGTLQSCNDFGGYHGSINLDAAHGMQNVAYAVIPRCSNFGGLLGIDAVTGAESHELIEAVTDPFPQNAPAFGQPDDADIYWLFALGGGEIGDMCAQEPQAFTKFAELPYEVQRTWSNAAAKKGHDPCVPALPGEVYFNAAPVLNDTITINVGQTVNMKGAHVPVGQSKTIDLDLYSDGDTGGPWQVQVQDLNALMGQAPELQLTLDRDSGQNGEKLHLTIKTLKASQFGASVFFIISSQKGQENLWLGLVGN